MSSSDVEAGIQMVKVVLACAPIVGYWAASAAFAWIRFPVRRGALRQRWRDLRTQPAGTASGIVDLSRDAAARIVGLRTGSMVRGVAGIALVAAVLFEASLPVAAIVLACVLWVHNRWSSAANLAYHRIAGRQALAFDRESWLYLYPGHRRGLLRNFVRSYPSGALSSVGIGLILAAGLPLAFQSDTLITAVPGIYVSHSHLPWWVLGSISFAAGTVLAQAGLFVERRTRRAAMQRETALRTTRLRRGTPPVVFLRPFGSERLRVPAHPGPRREGLSQLLPKRMEYLEDVTTWLLWSRGEVVAIADPQRARVGTVGAARHPLPADRDWREGVERLLLRASAIVLVPGTTPGVAWEVDRVANDAGLARKTLFLNPHPRARAAGFLDVFQGTTDQHAALTARGLLPVAAVIAPGGPVLLCSTLAEDVDYEAAVEWFLRSHLPPPEDGRWGQRVMNGLRLLRDAASGARAAG